MCLEPRIVLRLQNKQVFQKQKGDYSIKMAMNFVKFCTWFKSLLARRNRGCFALGLLLTVKWWHHNLRSALTRIAPSRAFAGLACRDHGRKLFTCPAALQLQVCKHMKRITIVFRFDLIWFDVMLALVLALPCHDKDKVLFFFFFSFVKYRLRQLTNREAHSVL